MFGNFKIFPLLILMIILNCSIVYGLTLTYDGVEHEYNAKDVTLMLNNDKFEPQEGQMPPIILNDRTLVPVREVFEYVGGKVNWDGSERRVDVTLDDKTISLWIDKTECKVNNETINVDVPAKIINNKTMVPARFISEQGGLVVGWNADTYTVDIKFPKAKITNIGFATIEGVNCLVATANSKITGYKYFSLPAEDESHSPLRLVLDIENCEFTFDTSNAKFDEGMLAGIRFGKQENDVNRIVLDLREDTDYVVTLSKDRTKLYFAMAEEFKVPGDDLDNQDDTNVEKTIEDNEIIVDEKPSGELPKDDGDSTGEIPTKDSSGEISKVEEPKKSGDINLEAKNSSGENDKESIEQQVKDSSGEDSSKEQNNNSGDDKKIDVILSGENIIIDSENPNSSDDLEPIIDSYSDEESQEEIEYETFVESVKYSTSSERVKIKYDGSITYSDSVLTNPNRVVIDIEDAKLDTTGPTEISIKNSIITQVRFSQYTRSTVRIVLDLSARGDYKIYKRSSELQVEVKESTIKNIKYKKNTSNSQVTLLNTDITQIDTMQSETMFRYTIDYDTRNNDFGNGTMVVDDLFVKSINVNDGTIIIADTGHKAYSIRQSNKNVVITIREKEDKEPEPEVIFVPFESGDEVSGEASGELIYLNKKKIMIDVGHGGSDPGACNGDEQEKKYNLNIALALYDLLKERKDIEVYIDREDNDTYLNREDRVAYATNLKPDFIVSIHNNSLENKSYSGTMVLYYNNDTESDYGDITSKECAEIILKELVNSLNTINRGVVSRGDLHILSKTPCPSVLCEVCFVSNDAELDRLKTKSFQESAALAIYNGIDQILKEL